MLYLCKGVSTVDELRNKKVLITGGAGFIGTALAERLAEHNEITLADINLEHNSFKFSRVLGKGCVKVAKVDVLNMDEVIRVISQAQIVIHTAAVLGVRKVIHNTLSTLEVNLMGTSNILKAASQNSNCERVLFFSTSEVFGGNAYRVNEGGGAVFRPIEDPRWCYSISKLAGEHLAFGYFREKRLPVVVVRPFNVFGPGRIGDYVILRFIMKALKDEDLEVYGDGTQIRAWCYIDDFCDALTMCLATKEAVGQAFNIGNPRNVISNYELAKMIRSICGSESRIVFKSVDFTDIDIRVPDISKAKDILGYVPEVELEEGLSRTIAWVKNSYDRLPVHQY